MNFIVKLKWFFLCLDIWYIKDEFIPLKRDTKIGFLITGISVIFITEGKTEIEEVGKTEIEEDGKIKLEVGKIKLEVSKIKLEVSKLVGLVTSELWIVMFKVINGVDKNCDHEIVSITLSGEMTLRWQIYL